jgi:hypothetical protein
VPVAEPIWKGLASGSLTEIPGSGAVKVAEKVIYTQRLGGRYEDAVTFALSRYRGSQWIVTIGSVAFVLFVEDATVEHERGGKGFVTVTYSAASVSGGGGSVLPPDEFALTPFEINPPIEQNNAFSTLTGHELHLARGAFLAPSASARTDYLNHINGHANSDMIMKLLDHWFAGRETYYLCGYTFSHTLHFATSPAASSGGFIQAPFGAFSGYVTMAGLSWLRKADEVVWSNGIWRVTRSWLGGPIGYWSTDLYETVS